MAARISRDDARAWIARWDEVDRSLANEMRALTSEAKVEQLAALVRSSYLFEPSAFREEENQRVREIWMRLRGLERS